MFYHIFVRKAYTFGIRAFGRYGSLGMIPGPIWKKPCYNLYVLSLYGLTINKWFNACNNRVFTTVILPIIALDHCLLDYIFYLKDVFLII